MYDYHQTEEQLWTVFADGDTRRPVSDHGSEAEARDEATRLNGGIPRSDFDALVKRVDALEAKRQPAASDAATDERTPSSWPVDFTDEGGIRCIDERCWCETDYPIGLIPQRHESDGVFVNVTRLGVSVAWLTNLAEIHLRQFGGAS